MPAFGALALLSTPVAWVLDHRRDSVGESRRRPTYVALVLMGAFWASTLPLGGLVMEASAVVSKERALTVASAAEEFRVARGHWPESMSDLEAQAGKRLPRPTFYGAFHFIHGAGPESGRPDERFNVRFSAWSLLGAYSWEYDVSTKTWREYGD